MSETEPVEKRGPGRPRRTDSLRETLCFRLAIEEREKLKDAAKRVGKSESELAREIIVWAIEQSEANHCDRGQAPAG